MSFRKEVEVLLFLQDKPLTSTELAMMIGAETAEIRQAIKDLAQELEYRGSGLRVQHTNGGYILEPEPSMQYIIDKVAPVELRPSIARTLALVLLLAPVKQSVIIQKRGSSAYDHIKYLVEQKWLKKEKPEDSISHILTITRECKRYFGLSDDAKQYQSQIKKLYETVNADNDPDTDLTESSLLEDDETTLITIE